MKTTKRSESKESFFHLTEIVHTYQKKQTKMNLIVHFHISISKIMQFYERIGYEHILFMVLYQQI